MYIMLQILAIVGSNGSSNPNGFEQSVHSLSKGGFSIYVKFDPHDLDEWEIYYHSTWTACLFNNQ